MAEITGTSGPVTKIDVLGGVPGAAGVSVTTAELDANGHLIIGKSNGVTIDVGKVRVDVTPEVQAAWDGAVAAETEATTQAGIATTAASNAKDSETKAAASAAAASGAAASEAAAKTSETNAASSATNAAESATTATTKAGVASSAATAAATSASNASLSESAAATSESNAATAASNAATSESNTATSESQAAASAGVAQAAAASASTARDQAQEARSGAESAAASADAARDQAATSATTLNTWFLRGNGSPVGVITPASAGVQYVDLAATNGARIWLSTGTNASAWRVVDGDTGVRKLSIDATYWTGEFVIRRVNGIISVCGFQNQAVAGSGANPKINPFIPSGGLPTGFRPLWRDRAFPIAGDENITQAYVRSGSAKLNGALYFVPNWPNNGRLTGFYEAELVWPTALPGTPA